MACEKHSSADSISILLFGSNFQNRNTLRDQIREQLGVSTGFDWRSIVSALETAAQTYGCRLLFVIDGLNESPVWDSVFKDQMDEVISDLTASPWIGVVVTARRSYSFPLFGSSYPPNSIFINPNTDIDKYLKSYIAHYNISFSNIPHSIDRLLNDRFFIALIAKTYGKENSQPPVTVPLPEIDAPDIFEEYIRKQDRIVCQKMRSPGGCSTLKTKLLTISTKMFESKSLSLPKRDAIEALENKPADQVRIDDSWTYTALDQGLLIDATWWNNREVIEFSHQSLADYLIAFHIVEGRSEKEIVRLISGLEGFPFINDILPMIALLLPSKIKKNLYEIIPASDSVDSAQLKAIFDMKPSRLDAGIRDWLDQQCKKAPGGMTSGIFYHLFRSASYLGFLFNANYFDEQLRNMSMQTRDLSWTEWIRKNDYDILICIDDFEKICIDEFDQYGHESLRLQATLISWFLTSTNRPLRDLATRALYWYGVRFPKKLYDMTIKSLEVNDPYVPDRMLAASYGVAMALQRLEGNESFLHEILPYYARKIYDLIFSETAPYSTTHALMRDYAMHTIEICLLHKEFLTSEEIERTRPPFKGMGITDWGTIEESDKENYKNGSPPVHMDFLNYTIGRLTPLRKNYDFDDANHKMVVGNLFWRIYDLGYSHELFSEADRVIAKSAPLTRSDRPNKIDRYGKKYSWIAFFEIAGRLLDEGIIEYDVDGRLSSCDIDPSFPGAPDEINIVTANFLSDGPTELPEWISQGPDPDIKPYLMLDDIDDQRGPWIMLNGYLGQENNETKKGMFLFSRGFLVKRNLLDSTPEYRDKLFREGMRLPDPEGDYYTFAGEIPWCRTFPRTKYSQHLSIPTGEFETIGTPTDEIASIILKFDDIEHRIGPSEEDIKRGYTESTVEKTVELDILIPVRDFSWESYHSVTNPGQGGDMPIREICDNLKLHIHPQSFDLYDQNLSKASICIRWGKWPTMQKLLFLRKDLFDAYLRETAQELIWIIWGERKYSSRENEGLREFASKQKSHHTFWELVLYSDISSR